MTFTPQDYAELLGLYLGDGYITRVARVYRLRIFLDTRHEQIISSTRLLLARCFPGRSVGLVLLDKRSTAVVSLYACHLPCLFPQHGVGKKHLREIALEPWQQAIVGEAPFALLRGLIRSDGCVYVNRTGPYEYLSYHFHSHSSGILGIFTWACDLAGIEYRCYARDVRIYRRDSVHRLLSEVGIKR